MVPTETRKRKLRIFFTISSFPVTLFPEHTHPPPVIFFLKGATCLRLKGAQLHKLFTEATKLDLEA